MSEEAKHTPGEWVSDGVLVDVDGKMIAHCGDLVIDGDGTLPEAEANARLIAASPQLLGACEAAREFGSDGTMEDGRSVNTLLRAAIAAAKGEGKP